MVFWDPKKQKRICRVTPFLLEDPQGKRKALGLAEEKGKWAAADKGTAGSERWESWVPRFLEAKYAGPSREKTMTRMMSAWRQWALFLSDRSLSVPRSVEYKNLLEFVAWRSAQVKRVSRKIVSKNTALTDVKCFSIVMREAVKGTATRSIILVSIWASLEIRPPRSPRSRTRRSPRSGRS